MGPGSHRAMRGLAGATRLRPSGFGGLLTMRAGAAALDLARRLSPWRNGGRDRMPSAETATMRMEVNPRLLRGARERSGLDADTLGHRFPRLADWERSERSQIPTRVEAAA